MSEPFIIMCETCQSRLRVRSEAAVGSILACPKCQSLVHVTPPEESGLAKASPATEDGNADLEGPPPANFLPAKLALAAVILIAVVGAGLLVGLGRSSESETRPHGSSHVAAGAAAAEQEAPPEAGDTIAQEAAGGAAEATTDKASAGTVDAKLRSDETSRPPSGDSDASEGPPVLPRPLPAPADAAGADDAERPARTERNVPPIGIAQLDFDFLPGGGVFSGTAPQPSDVVADASPPESGEASELAETPPEPPASSSVRMAIARVDADRPSQGAADPTEALSLPLVELDLSKTSAVQAVRLIADLTGATITVTPEAYRALQAATGAIATRQSQATAGDALAAILKPHGLHVEERGPHLIVLPIESLPESNTAAGSGQFTKQLQQSVTFTFTAPTPLAEVLRHLESAVGLTLLVDWQSLSERKLGPSSLITASVVDQPLGDVLDGLLPQLGIGCSPVGDSAVWITVR